MASTAAVSAAVAAADSPADGRLLKFNSACSRTDHVHCHVAQTPNTVSIPAVQICVPPTHRDSHDCVRASEGDPHSPSQGGTIWCRRQEISAGIQCHQHNHGGACAPPALPACAPPSMLTKAQHGGPPQPTLASATCCHRALSMFVAVLVATLLLSTLPGAAATRTLKATQVCHTLALSTHCHCCW